jgi:hypothetical protein
MCDKMHPNALIRCVLIFGFIYKGRSPGIMPLSNEQALPCGAGLAIKIHFSAKF